MPAALAQSASSNGAQAAMEDPSSTPFLPGTLPPVYTPTTFYTGTFLPSFTPFPSATPFSSLTPLPTFTLTPTITRTPAPTRTPRLLFVSKGDLHMHTTCSDGENTFEEMAADLKRDGDTFFAITDHHWCQDIADACARWDQMPCFMGTEITCDSYVEVLAIGIRKPIKDLMTPAETVAAIHAQGGIAIAAHPWAYGAKYTEDELLKSNFDAMECPPDGSYKLDFDASVLPCMYDSDAHNVESLDPWSGSVCTIPINSIDDLRTAIKGRMCYSAILMLPKTTGDWQLPVSPP
jgi:hypothetical protein